MPECNDAFLIFQNKDVFMIYHKAHLTRRLILGTSADSEKEENMVEWLREVGMPADFINKLSRMFQDMKVSEDLNAQFKNHLVKQESKQSLADSVSIKILNVAAWARSNERVPVTLPRELEDYIPEVEDFYKVMNSFKFAGNDEKAPESGVVYRSMWARITFE